MSTEDTTRTALGAPEPNVIKPTSQLGENGQSAPQNAQNVPLLTTVRAESSIAELRKEFAKKIMSLDPTQQLAPDSPVKENRLKAAKYPESDTEADLAYLSNILEGKL